MKKGLYLTTSAGHLVPVGKRALLFVDAIYLDEIKKVMKNECSSTLSFIQMCRKVMIELIKYATIAENHQYNVYRYIFYIHLSRRDLPQAFILNWFLHFFYHMYMMVALYKAIPPFTITESIILGKLDDILQTCKLRRCISGILRVYAET